MVSAAVNVTDAPAQLGLLPEVIEIVIVGVTEGLTVTVIGVAAPVHEPADEVGVTL